MSEISDDWDTIIAAIDAGTYKTKYKIGQYKPLDLGTEGTINMQIVAMDADELADGSGYAPLTFVGIELLNTNAKMSGVHEEGWGSSTLYTQISGNVFNMIPNAVKNRIQMVEKHSIIRSSPGVISNNVLVWIPSLAEIYGTTSSSEWQGVSYKKVFRVAGATIKKYATSGNAGTWWTRTQATGTSQSQRYIRFSENGSYSGVLSGTASGICLGFCLGLEPETITDSWETILANENYATDYSIGDTKYIDLGTEGKHLMEIVAFDTDDKADGSGKAGITWISKDLMNTGHRMNSTYTTVGGWRDSEMRAYLKDTIKLLIPSEVRNSIVEVSKISSTYENGAKVVNGQITTDDVWIPSSHEIIKDLNIHENTGATYWTKYTDTTERIKRKNGDASAYYLRSSVSDGEFSLITTSGSIYSRSARIEQGIALGFCTN